LLVNRFIHLYFYYFWLSALILTTQPTYYYAHIHFLGLFSANASFESYFLSAMWQWLYSQFLCLYLFGTSRLTDQIIRKHSPSMEKHEEYFFLYFLLVMTQSGAKTSTIHMSFAIINIFILFTLAIFHCFLLNLIISLSKVLI